VNIESFKDIRSVQAHCLTLNIKHGIGAFQATDLIHEYEGKHFNHHPKIASLLARQWLKQPKLFRWSKIGHLRLRIGAQ